MTKTKKKPKQIKIGKFMLYTGKPQFGDRFAQTTGFFEKGKGKEKGKKGKTTQYTRLWWRLYKKK